MKITIFKFEEDPFSKNAEGNNKTSREVLLIMKFLQTKPQVKNLNINFFGLYYTVIKNRDDKEIVVDDEYKKDYIIFNDFISPNHYIGREDNMILR